jgi:hypothetical protein
MARKATPIMAQIRRIGSQDRNTYTIGAVKILLDGDRAHVSSATKIQLVEAHHLTPYSSSGWCMGLHP